MVCHIQSTTQQKHRRQTKSVKIEVRFSVLLARPCMQVIHVYVSGVKVYIEPRALMNILGTVMDWQEDEVAAEFVFNNPNASGTCGCKESFHLRQDRNE